MKAISFRELMKSCKNIYRQNASYLNWIEFEVDCVNKTITASCACDTKGALSIKPIKEANSSFKFYTKDFEMGKINALTSLAIEQKDNVLTACYNNVRIQLCTPDIGELYGDNPFSILKRAKGDNNWKGGVSVNGEYLKHVVNSLPNDVIVDISFMPLMNHSANMLFEVSTPIGVEKRILAPVLKDRIIPEEK